jgi:hypothetical protein
VKYAARKNKMGEKKVEWISLDEAEILVKGYYARSTLYKFISKKRLDRRGPYHRTFVRKDQLLKVCKLEGLIDA